MRSVCPHCCWPDWERLARWQNSFSSGLPVWLGVLVVYLDIYISVASVGQFYETDWTVYLIWRREKSQEEREEDTWMNINRSFKPLQIRSLWSLFYGWDIQYLESFAHNKSGKLNWVKDISKFSDSVYLFSSVFSQENIVLNYCLNGLYWLAK